MIGNLKKLLPDRAWVQGLIHEVPTHGPEALMIIGFDDGTWMEWVLEGFKEDDRTLARALKLWETKGHALFQAAAHGQCDWEKKPGWACGGLPLFNETDFQIPSDNDVDGFTKAMKQEMEEVKWCDWEEFEFDGRGPC